MKRVLVAAACLLSTALLLTTGAGISLALALPSKGQGPAPRPPLKPRTGVDSGVQPQPDGGGESAALGATTDAGAPVISPMQSDAGGDNGSRLSPLTPPAAEFPQAIDGGLSPQSFDYDRVLSDIAALRARVSAATELMFRSRLTVQVRSDGKYAKIARLSVALDDGTVFTGKPGFKPDDFVVVYDHAVAPGRHAVTVDVERADEREDGFRSAQKSRLIVDVPKDQKLNVEVILVDESTMGGDFPSDKSGRYDLRIRMRAAAKAAP
jgi:hypothetical protein